MKRIVASLLGIASLLAVAWATPAAALGFCLGTTIEARTGTDNYWTDHGTPATVVKPGSRIVYVVVVTNCGDDMPVGTQLVVESAIPDGTNLDTTADEDCINPFDPSQNDNGNGCVFVPAPTPGLPPPKHSVHQYHRSFSFVTQGFAAGATLTKVFAVKLPDDFTQDHTAGPPDCPGASIYNDAHATAALLGALTIASGDSAPLCTTWSPHISDLSIDKSAPASVNDGDGFSYSIDVANAGPDAVSGIEISDPLPSNVAFSSASGDGWTCGEASGTVTCTRDDAQAPGADIPAVTVAVTATAPGSAANTATVTVTDPTSKDPASGNDSDTATTTVNALADVSISKTGPATAASGDTITYSITVSNAGPSDAQSVTVSDPLPAGTSLVSATPSQGSCSGSLSCSLGTIADGGSATVSVSVQVTGTGSITNTATVSSSTPDPASGNNSSSVATTVARATVILHVNGGTINVNSPKQGTVLVWVEHTTSFDSTKITTACLGPAANPQSGDCNPTGVTLNDRDADLDLDWSAKFAAKKTNLATGSSVVVCIEGTTSTGVAYRGCDTVNVI